MNKKEKSFGTYLRDYRVSSKISLRKLAEEAELDPAYLSRIERGEIQRPGREFIEKIAAALCRKKELQETKCDELNRHLLLMAKYKLSDAEFLGLKLNQSIPIEELFAQRLIEGGVPEPFVLEAKKNVPPHQMTKVLSGELPLNIKNIDGASYKISPDFSSIPFEDSTSEIQTEAILELKLRHLAKLEEIKIKSEEVSLGKERKFQAGARAFIQVDGDLTTSQEQQLRALTALVKSILKVNK